MKRFGAAAALTITSRHYCPAGADLVDFIQASLA